MKWIVGITAVAATMAIAACGSSGSSGGTSSASAPSAASGTAASSATAVSSPAASTSSGQGGGVAAPGTSLSLGQTATLLFTPPGATNGPTYKLQVTVRSIRKGTLADFNGIQLNAAEKASTPVYVKVHIKNVDTKAITGSNDYPAVPLEGVDNTQQSQQSVTFIGDFPPCPDNDAPKPFTPGQTFDTCLTFLIPGGITKVAWNGTDQYMNTPVTWAAN